jgi:hypothetical protein
VVLVGGTALAGYYAGHRRSDDLDLFCRNAVAFEALRRLVPTLQALGAKVQPQHTTPVFHRSLVELDGHSFTIDAVLDENLFRVGHTQMCEGVTVATLQTLLMCKAATLISRCSEKDLYDLVWICARDEQLQLADLIELGHQIDGGVDAESLLISLTGSTVSERACNFALSGGPSAAQICEQIVAFKGALQDAIAAHLQGQSPTPLARTVALLARKRR